ncbi:MAG: hypothetical protein ABSC62_13250 [Terracidiphilus sp.]|jgi:hypothetical protein
MTEPDFDPEKLRPAEYICEPDPRNTNIVWPDPGTGALRPAKASDLHDAVAAFSLHAGVPEDIVQHFETVKNLYLYSWFIYRFQPVAELESLACLEFALRERLATEIRSGKIKEKMLRGLLKYAFENRLIQNEGFARWIKANDPEWDLLASLETVFPQIRNDHAHGSYTLAPTALGIIELVHEIINQLFAVPNAAP